MKQRADEMDLLFEGFKKGMEEGKIEVAKKLKESMSDEEISKIMDIDLELLKNL